MSQHVLLIQWGDWDELVILDKITPAPQVVRTSERWKKVDGTPTVSYVASVVSFSRRGEKNTLRLRYEERPQTDDLVLDPSNQVRWGLSVVTWDTAGLRASAEWIDANDKEFSGPARKVTVLGGQGPVTNLRESASVIVKTRPKQAALRGALLLMDGSCFLTGEKEPAALEAAHIVPVKAGGIENVDNAILLRADLHRLFDAGLFWFDLSGEKAVVRHSLSGTYNEILTGKKLPEITFERVARALHDRAKLRDGRGAGA